MNQETKTRPQRALPPRLTFMSLLAFLPPRKESGTSLRNRHREPNNNQTNGQVQRMCGPLGEWSDLFRISHGFVGEFQGPSEDGEGPGPAARSKRVPTSNNKLKKMFHKLPSDLFGLCLACLDEASCDSCLTLEKIHTSVVPSASPSSPPPPQKKSSGDIPKNHCEAYLGLLIS